MILFFILLLCCSTNAYDKFLRNLPLQFNYATNLICDFIEKDGMYYASVADAYTFARSQAVAVWPNLKKQYVPEACFLYAGQSYMFFSNKEEENKLEVLINRKNYTSQLQGKILFDSFTNRLYIFRENVIQDVSILGEEFKVGDFHLRVEEKVLDIMIANGDLFYIARDEGLAYDFLKNDKVRRRSSSKNIFRRISLFDPESESSESTNLSLFDFIPVAMNEGQIASIPLPPKRPEIQHNGWLFVLYIIDVAIFILLIYVIKIGGQAIKQEQQGTTRLAAV